MPFKIPTSLVIDHYFPVEKMYQQTAYSSVRSQSRNSTLVPYFTYTVVIRDTISDLLSISTRPRLRDINSPLRIPLLTKTPGTTRKAGRRLCRLWRAYWNSCTWQGRRQRQQTDGGGKHVTETAEPLLFDPGEGQS